MAERASRHARDPVSLVMGLVLLSGAALFLLVDLTDRDVELRWVGPAVLILIGLVGLIASLRPRPGRQD